MDKKSLENVKKILVAVNKAAESTGHEIVLLHLKNRDIVGFEHVIN